MKRIFRVQEALDFVQKLPRKDEITRPPTASRVGLRRGDDGDLLKPRDWTAIVPAAGRGSRLGMTDKPKILYEVNGKTILYWITCLLEPFCHEIILIASPQFEDLLRMKIEELIPGRTRVLVQKTPQGMADAIYQAQGEVHTSNSLVMWGDQVAIKASTIEACMRVHSHEVNLTLPTVSVQDPYIHFVRDKEDRIIQVQEKREGTITSNVGEGDCGLFLFRTAVLFSLIQENRENKSCLGKSTGELNLLPMIPFFENKNGMIRTVRLDHSEEALGINTSDNADAVEKILKQRAEYEYSKKQ